MCSTMNIDNKEWELADLQPRLHVCGCPSAHFSCGSLQHAAVIVDRQTWSCAKLAQLAHLVLVDGDGGDGEDGDGGGEPGRGAMPHQVLP